MPADWPTGDTRPRRREGASAVELDDNLALYDDVGQLLILLNASEPRYGSSATASPRSTTWSEHSLTPTTRTRG